MNIYKKSTLSRRIAVLGVTSALTLGMTLGGYPFSALAGTHAKISEGTYQLLDGTAISGVVSRGIDTSHWQGDIDWQKVARDDVSFVMLGTRYKGEVDPQFRTNAEGAANAGIQLGAYLYSYALTVEEAEAEADFILDLIKDYPISYPVAFDIEDSSQTSLSPSEITAMINAFCKKIKDAGYYPLVYANDYWLANRIDLSQLQYDVWVARYETQHDFEHPVMWQATSTGSVDGITGNVDIDFQYQDFSNRISANLWRTIGDKTYYYQDYVMQKNTWIQDGTGWFYMNADGQASTGWLTQSGLTYHLDESSGRMTTGWLQSSDGWHYFGNDGAMQNGWIQDTGTWYHINNSGIMDTGLLQDGGKWYYLHSSGAMRTGWQQIGDAWYYFGGDGSMRTGWVGDDSAWYYLNPESGVMYANTQITVNDIMYDVDASGVCHEVVPETETSAEGAEDVPETGAASETGVPSESGTADETSTETASATGIESAADPAAAPTILPFGN